MGKKVSARIKNRVKMHFVRAIMMLEKKFGSRERKFEARSGKSEKKSA